MLFCQRVKTVAHAVELPELRAEPHLGASLCPITTFVQVEIAEFVVRDLPGEHVIEAVKIF